MQDSFNAAEYMLCLELDSSYGMMSFFVKDEKFFNFSKTKNVNKKSAI